MDAVNRRTDIDILRFFAVLLVLGRHLLHLSENSPSFIIIILIAWRKIGWIGVDLFFVLSGFLIHSLLIKEYLRYGNIRPIYFLARRAFKLYPPFYFMLFINLMLIGFSFNPRLLLGEVLFLQNYVGMIWNHTWSLAVEEHFYLIWVFCCYRASKNFSRFSRTLFWGSLVAIVLVTVARCATVLLTSFKLIIVSNDALLTQTHFRLDSLIWGCCVAHIWHFWPDRVAAYGGVIRHTYKPLIILAFLLPYYYSVDDTNVMHGLGFTFLSIAFSTLLFQLLLDDRLLRLSSRGWLNKLSILGRYSYSTYLWHMMVYQICIYFFWTRMPTDIFVLTYLVLSYAVGIATSEFLELPLLWVRDRVFPSRAEFSKT